MLKAPPVQSTFGSRVELCKTRARHCGAIHIPKSKCLKHPSEHFCQLRRWKNARSCGAKQMSKSKCEKHTTLGPILGVRVSFFMAGARWQAWGSHDLASLFCGGRNTLDRWSGKSQNAMVRGCHSAVNFYFLREVSQNWFVLMLSTSNSEEIWQNCSSFDVAIGFLRKSCGICLCTGEFAFCEEVSQNCFVFDLSTSTCHGNLAEILFVSDIDR